ncbi:MAG: hypothetical protein UX99_C0037G0014 [Candidatus Amesbacteria bacterium GW2011_GWB1_47_26]|uniref:DUF218 domain-containing protein n=1 Tax=Candidatus Amesbacteria bacterium GW2011_GWC2_45_19 TaxID=1618366 RepID=A0A0G1M3W9_9BACT|nr:MAG: hypothetical protein UX05_C0007G0016 [Candidatus Amesbacteria bacterium GW2011_GWC2_45_19]KKU68367.1 MAG: hypothetical protein UX93_C0008G0016 [Microgenomates group bacterium GW2011_GWC1_47_20]KKU72949.1 MAG: hypothetical protein UX99_C0037G0014 [Candidatus Amesbacteria bacterium GW2011_GWB1_47_26]
MQTQNREISKQVTPPKLGQQTINLLNELCFLPDSPIQKVDLIFVFGVMQFDLAAKAAKELLIKNTSKKVIVSGGTPQFSDHSLLSYTKPESEEILQRIDPKNFPLVIFETESVANNTVENVRLSLNKFPYLSEVKKIFYLCHSHGSRRCYLSLRKFLPKTKLLLKSFPRKLSNNLSVVSREKWFLSGEGTERVWAEFLRIKKYGERGDIVYNSETKGLVDEITSLTASPIS